MTKKIYRKYLKFYFKCIVQIITIFFLLKTWWNEKTQKLTFHSMIYFFLFTLYAKIINCKTNMDEKFVECCYNNYSTRVIIVEFFWKFLKWIISTCINIALGDSKCACI